MTAMSTVISTGMPAGVDALTARGQVIRLRPVTPADADGLLALHERASGRSVYLRFFSGGPSLRVPFVQMAELDSEEGCLDRMQTAVVTLEVVVVLLRLAMLAQHLDRLRRLVVARRHGAAFAARTEVFARIETERRRVA